MLFRSRGKSSDISSYTTTPGSDVRVIAEHANKIFDDAYDIEHSHSNSVPSNKVPNNNGNLQDTVAYIQNKMNENTK